MSATNSAGLKIGDLLSETQYYTVVQGVHGGLSGQVISVRNERGFVFDVSPNIVEEGMQSAHQFDSTNYINQTAMALKLLELDNAVFEVGFNKQPKAEDINEAIESANKGRIAPIADLKAAVKAAYKGESRTLRGYKIGNEAHFGRIKVIDLEAKSTKDSGIRLVDLRNVNYLIHKGVKYVVN
jgi:hypothetical protein